MISVLAVAPASFVTTVVGALGLANGDGHLGPSAPESQRMASKTGTKQPPIMPPTQPPSQPPDVGGSIGGEGASNWTRATVGVVFASTVTPSELERSASLVVSMNVDTCSTVAWSWVLTLATTSTLADLTSSVMSAAVIPIPRVEARLALNASASNVSTAPLRVSENDTTGA